MNRGLHHYEQAVEWHCEECRKDFIVKVKIDQHATEKEYKKKVNSAFYYKDQHAIITIKLSTASLLMLL